MMEQVGVVLKWQYNISYMFGIWPMQDLIERWTKGGSVLKDN